MQKRAKIENENVVKHANKGTKNPDKLTLRLVIIDRGDIGSHRGFNFSAPRTIGWKWKNQKRGYTPAQVACRPPAEQKQVPIKLHPFLELWERRLRYYFKRKFMIHVPCITDRYFIIRVDRHFVIILLITLVKKGKCPKPPFFTFS